MTNKERKKIFDSVALLSDDDLLALYYRSAYDCLGSLCDDMYNMGYDVIDIYEQQKYEQYLCDYSDVLEDVCLSRGLKLWEE